MSPVLAFLKAMALRAHHQSKGRGLQLSIWICDATITAGEDRPDGEEANGRIAEATRPFRVSRFLEWLDVRGLQALRPARDFEFHRLPFVERLVPLRLDGGKVDENVLAALALDESKALAGVEPLHCSLFFHFFFSLLD
jgi:hypothetical protein